MGKAASRIREEIESGNMGLSSFKVARLVKTLAPYGARCEDNRKKGIMIKLPSSIPGKPFVSKFIHRTHASHDTLDRNSIEALQELFGSSVFSIEKFRTGAME